MAPLNRKTSDVYKFFALLADLATGSPDDASPGQDNRPLREAGGLSVKIRRASIGVAPPHDTRTGGQKRRTPARYFLSASGPYRSTH